MNELNTFLSKGLEKSANAIGDSFKLKGYSNKTFRGVIDRNPIQVEMEEAGYTRKVTITCDAYISQFTEGLPGGRLEFEIVGENVVYNILDVTRTGSSYFFNLQEKKSKNRWS